MDYKEITSANILAKRWYDKRNGNTYHKVYVTLFAGSEELELESDFTYGYSQQWDQTALDVFYKQFPRCPKILWGNGNKKYPYLTAMLQHQLNVITSDEVIDVNKKGDL